MLQAHTGDREQAAVIGVLGGTFDPIHCGHLRAGLEVVEALGLQALHLVPCHVPPHRPAPVATADQRLAMAARALLGVPRFVLDERELKRSGPSYTVTTLAELRAEVGPDMPLVLLVGLDAVAGFKNWHQWEKIHSLAHLVVLTRPDVGGGSVEAQYRVFRRAERNVDLTAPEPDLGLARASLNSGLTPPALNAGLAPADFNAGFIRADLNSGLAPPDLNLGFSRAGQNLGFTPADLSLGFTRAESVSALTQAPAGLLWVQTVTPLAISATFIRQRLSAGFSARFLVPDAVHDYIQQHGLYRPESEDNL